MKLNHKKILQEVARLSPPEYALQIRERNKKALAALDALWERRAEIDKSFDVGASIVEIGCPHCLACSLCIWLQAVENVHGEDVWNHIEGGADDICIEIKFDGISLIDVEGSFCSVYYSQSDAEVVMDHAETTAQKQSRAAQYKKCRRFLEAHIRWSYSSLWKKGK